MSKKPPQPPRRRHLTSDDHALWDHTASSVEPLKVKKGRHHPGSEDPEHARPFEPKTKAAKKSDASPPSRSEPQIKPAPAPRTAPDLSAFDRKAARRLRQGQIDIEARIDLHGLRQHEAHLALRRFLLSCVGRGLRWVLVITGKGAPSRRNDDPWSDQPERSERGVLRKNVPQWLSEPELRAVVVSFTTAAIPHGGEGALYVQLRSKDRAR